MTKYRTSTEIAAMLKARISYEITHSALARQLGVSPGFLSALLKGRCAVGPKILEVLGYEITPYYRQKE